MKRLFIIFVLFGVMISLMGCVASDKGIIAKEEPVSPEEREIKAFLADYKKAWDGKDVNTLVSFYHDDAKIMTGRKHKIVSKKQYANIIPDRFKQLGSVTFGAPKIKITGDKAKVKTTTRFSQGMKSWLIFYMIQQNSRWLIIEQKY